ncbi:MAG: PilZ domain-containing protein [Magnetococcales bacterium]|nr:PilZ domain-containing protein [Magnetococcales bacterium]
MNRMDSQFDCSGASVMISRAMVTQQRNFFRLSSLLSVRWRELDSQAQQAARLFFAKTGVLPFRQEIDLERSLPDPIAFPGHAGRERVRVIYESADDVQGDVSGGGLSFLLRRTELQNESILALQFTVMGANLPELVCMARVVRVRAVTGADRHQQGHSHQDRRQVICEFILMAVQDQDDLVAYITRAQQARLRSQNSRRISWGDLTRSSRPISQDHTQVILDTEQKEHASRAGSLSGNKRGGTRVVRKIAGVVQRMMQANKLLPEQKSRLHETIASQEREYPEWHGTGWHDSGKADEDSIQLPATPAWGEEEPSEASFTAEDLSVEVVLPFYWENISPGLLEWIRESLAQEGRFPDARQLPSRLRAREAFMSNVKTLGVTHARLAQLMNALRLLLDAVSARGVVPDEEDPFLTVIRRLDVLVVSLVGQDAESTVACGKVFQSYLKILQQILAARRQAKVRDVEQQMRCIRKEMTSCLALQRRREKSNLRKQIQNLGENLDTLVKWVIRQDMITLLGYVMTPVVVQMGPGEGPVIHFMVPAPPPEVDDVLRLRFAIPEDPWHWLACIGVVAAVTEHTDEGTWYSIWCRITVIQNEDQERLWHLVSDRLPGM